VSIEGIETKINLAKESISLISDPKVAEALEHLSDALFEVLEQMKMDNDDILELQEELGIESEPEDAPGLDDTGKPGLS
jgi:hypothetical protein